MDLDRLCIGDLQLLDPNRMVLGAMNLGNVMASMGEGGGEVAAIDTAAYVPTIPTPSEIAAEDLRRAVGCRGSRSVPDLERGRPEGLGGDERRLAAVTGSKLHDGQRSCSASSRNSSGTDACSDIAVET
jgi:hypothetical protein